MCRIKLLTPVSLAVNNVGRNDKGIYQCSVTNKRNSAQAMAELKLGGNHFFSLFFSLRDVYRQFYLITLPILLRIYYVRSAKSIFNREEETLRLMYK